MQDKHKAYAPDRLCLLVAPFSHPDKDLVATTLAWMCQEQGVAFDVYYTSQRADGGIFSPHGSAMVGGRHVSALVRAVAEYDTTVIRLGRVHLLGTLLNAGAAQVIDAPASLLDLYQVWAGRIGLDMPKLAVLYQTRDLPPGLMHGEVRPLTTPEGHKLSDDGSPRRGSVVPYAFPEAVQRRALALPLESSPQDIARVKASGVTAVWTVATADAGLAPWREAGFDPIAADVLLPDDTLTSFTFRIAERWLSRAAALDLNEPLLAGHLLPFAVRENRLSVCGDTMKEGAARLAPLAAAKGQDVVYGRYAGGAQLGALDDEDLFPLFKQNILFEVIEPGRPPITLFSHHPAKLPQPPHSPFDLEPCDEQLQTWARAGKVLVTLLTHSGELSHNDAILNLIDLSATTGVRAGIGMHYQRYSFAPEDVELLQVPVDEGGVLGLCEPLLHSGGYGIIAEGLADPGRMGALMRSARDRLAELAGERFVPRGVYCYCDALPPYWDRDAQTLWQAIREAGYEYVVSSVKPGGPRVLYRQGDFVVLNQYGSLHYPYSPFARIDVVDDLAAMERQLMAREGPAWILAVLDIPIYGYSNYLALGDPFKGRGGLGQFYAFIRAGGDSGQLISATPHTIARYARITADLGLTSAVDVPAV